MSLFSQKIVEPKIGFTGLYFDKTSIADIDYEKKIIMIRGYSMDQLESHTTLEEVIFLLLHGELPNLKQNTNIKKNNVVLLV